MNSKPFQTSRTIKKRGGVFSLNSCVPGAIGALQAQARRQQGKAIRGCWHAGQEIAILGRLLYHWPDIVGAELHIHTRPRRLFRGQLMISCEDSAWLHTLTFLRPQIKQRIQEGFPDIVITSIRGRIEPLPPLPTIVRPATWPVWEAQPEGQLPEIKSAELREQIHRCRKKLLARRQGLAADGWRPCPHCQVALIRSDRNRCGICEFQEQLQRFRRLRTSLEEVPWLTPAQLQEDIPGASILEIELTRQELIEEARARIPLLLNEETESPSREGFFNLREELLRLVILATGLSPDCLANDILETSRVLDPTWFSQLEVVKERLQC